VLSKQSGESNPVYVQDIGVSQLEQPVNQMDKSSIYASKISYKQPQNPLINNTSLAVHPGVKDYDGDEVTSEQSSLRQLAYSTTYRGQKNSSTQYVKNANRTSSNV